MQIPELIYPEDGVRIVSVDPGTSHLGLSVIDWKFGTTQGVVVWAGTLDVGNDTHPNSYAETVGRRDERVAKLRQQWIEFLRISCPTFVATETPFFRRGKISAFESGVELQLMLRNSLWDVYPDKYLHGFNPIIVKAHVGVDSRGTDKTHMFAAVTKLYKEHTQIDLTELDEHSIDSIAVGNAFIRLNLLSLNSLLPPKAPKPKGTKTRSRKRRAKRKKG